MNLKLKEMRFNESNLYGNINILGEQIIEQVTNFLYLATEKLGYYRDNDVDINVF
jgi:hypothetical protein